MEEKGRKQELGPSCLAQRRPRQPSGVLWARIFPGKTPVRQKCLALYIPPLLSLGVKSTSDKGLTSGQIALSSSRHALGRSQWLGGVCCPHSTQLGSETYSQRGI